MHGPDDDNGAAQRSSAPDVERAHHDAEAVVRIAFEQAQRMTARAEAERAAAEQALADARAESDAVLTKARQEATMLVQEAGRESERLTADAKRDRVLAEEVLLRARREADQEAEEIRARVLELAQSEARTLVDAARQRLADAREEAELLLADARREAEAIVAQAQARARATSAGLRTTPRPQLPTTPAATAPPSGQAVVPGATAPAPSPSPEPSDARVVDLRPRLAAATPPGELVVPAAAPEVDEAATQMANRQYRNSWSREPRVDDLDRIVSSSVHIAVRSAFATFDLPRPE